MCELDDTEADDDDAAPATPGKGAAAANEVNGGTKRKAGSEEVDGKGGAAKNMKTPKKPTKVKSKVKVKDESEEDVMVEDDSETAGSQ